MSRRRASDKQHRWLSLVEITGVVLSEPVLADAAPAGFRGLEKKELARFYKAREIWNLPKGMVEGDPDARWIDFVLEELLRLRPKYWQVGAAVSERLVVSLTQQREVLRPTRVLVDGDKAVLLLLRVPRDQGLDLQWVTGGTWKASPTTKFERLLRETGVEIGLLTNGDAWRLLVASPSETASWLTWTTQTWADSPSTLAAFVELLGEARFFAGPASGTILELVRASRQRQADVADRLGAQVREALEILVHEIDRIDAELDGSPLLDYCDEDVLEAAVVFLMRVLFLLKAEEAGLLPHGVVAFDRAYGVLHLLTRLENAYRLVPEKLEKSYEAYSQLLATFHLVHAGSSDPDIHVAPYGGRLFDPSRYPLLEGRRKNGSWPTSAEPEPLSVRDSVVREILRSLKYARGDGGVVQWVSYRTLEVEQIGHMYESLLDRRVARAPPGGALFLLRAADRDASPTITEAEVAEADGERLVRRLTELTGRSEGTVRSLLEPEEEPPRRSELGTNDPRLISLAKPIERLLRPRGVLRPGGLYVTTGADRRAQGAHYTPPELTEPLVRRTLEPLVYEGLAAGEPRDRWRLRSPQELLALKVCDLAMGSGAFLVQVVRYLSERLVEAWNLASAAVPGRALTMPHAKSSAGKADERLLPEEHGERRYWARRYVAEACIYGVDKNPLAVEMAKLSIWIETLAKDRPFTFLDHALRCGDALLGVDERQLRTWSLDGTGSGAPLLEGLISEGVDHARQLRLELEGRPVEAVADQGAKVELLRRVDEECQRLRLAGDLLIAAEVYAGSARERQQLRNDFLPPLIARDADLNSLHRDARKLLGASVPFHWPIEFPEVFGRGGFDAVVGNPPYLGGSRLSTELGEVYASYLKTRWQELAGKIDLVLFFFHRAASLLNEHGKLSFLTTYRVTDGANGVIGLRPFTQQPWLIYWAVKEQRWPGDASVRISQVSITRAPYAASLVLDGVTVPRIGCDLRSSVDLSDAAALPSNEGQSYQGANPDSLGFMLTDQERDRILLEHPQEHSVIRRYIVGNDLTKRSDRRGSRWIIDFTGLDEDHAKEFAACYDIVKRRVLPGRLKLKRKAYRDRWWQFTEPQAEAHAAARRLSRVLGISRVTKYVAWEWIDSQHVIAAKITMVLTDDPFFFGVLQSAFHEYWAYRMGGKFGVGGSFSYSPVRCFRTFPFPDASADQRRSVAEAGEAFQEARAYRLADRGIGLTKFYNEFHDPSCRSEAIQKLRELQVRLDHAVQNAYGFMNLQLNHAPVRANDTAGADEPTDDEPGSGWRFTISDHAREELLRQLLELNKRVAQQNQSAEDLPPKRRTRQKE
jgi:Eco57I restriction-modification methylase/restriction-modification enzyme MmeI-like protein